MTLDSQSPLQRLRQIEAEERAARLRSLTPTGAGRVGETPSPIGSDASRPDASRPDAPRRRGFWATISTALLVGLAKGKLLLGVLKIGPLIKTFSTLALSAWVYSRYYGANLAIGFVLLILLHEYGHGIAAKIMGLRVGAPIFVPFFGAVIALKEQPRTTWVDAVVGFGGPFAGMVGGVGVLAVGLALGHTYWGGLLIVLAWTTFTINLFNLTPVFGLDGDRVSQPFRPWFWIPGVALLVGLAVASFDALGHVHPTLLVTSICGAIKGLRAVRAERRARAAAAPTSLLQEVTRTPRYVAESTVEPWQRAASAWAYFGLVATLATLLFWSQELTRSLKP